MRLLTNSDEGTAGGQRADEELGAEITLRRFWKTVHIKEETDGFQVTLDHRNLKTPAGTKLVLPKDRRLLALLIANEWENQDEILKQHALPLVSSSDLPSSVVLAL